MIIDNFTDIKSFQDTYIGFSRAFEVLYRL